MKVFPEKTNSVQEIFSISKPIIGMIHLKPLPGSPHYKGGSLDNVVEYALKEVKTYKEGGIDGLIVENGWDLPFSKPEDIGHETSAAMTYITKSIIEETDLPVGINVLANGAIPALAIAKATGAPFIRVNQWVNAYVANEGIIEGASAKALRYRTKIKGEDIKIFTDVHVKHGSHSIVADRSLKDMTHDAVFFDSDVLIATGSRTGDETDTSEIQGIKEHTDLPVITGSGLTSKNAQKILKFADGSIVGSWLKKDNCWWKEVDINRVKELMEEVYKIRSI